MSLRLTLIAAGLVAAGLSPAADWPQWRGPHRDGVSPETGLMKAFPAGGPKLLWTSKDAGLGYSAVAVVGDRLYSWGDDDTEEFVFALDVKTGKRVWRQKVGTPYSNGWGGGPRCTPTVDGDRLYVLGPKGDLSCLETAGGRIVWQKSLTKDLGGKLMSGWGYSESPLVDGDQVVCSPGGEKGTLAALDKKTGQVRWRSSGLGAAATYSSIVVADVGGVRHYVQVTKDGPAGFAPKDGKVLWHETVVDEWRTATIPTPIVHGDLVYVTAAYDDGCGLIKLTPDGRGGLKSEVVYAKQVIANKHGGVILVGDYVYGDSDGKGLTCQELTTGKVAWTADHRKLEQSSLVAAGGHLYCYGQRTGALVCVEATPRGYAETGRFTIPKQTTRRSPSGGIWTHPVIAEGKLFLRDQEILFCFDLRDARERGE